MAHLAALTDSVGDIKVCYTHLHVCMDVCIYASCLTYPRMQFSLTHSLLPFHVCVCFMSLPPSLFVSQSVFYSLSPYLWLFLLISSSLFRTGARARSSSRLSSPALTFSLIHWHPLTNTQEMLQIQSGMLLEQSARLRSLEDKCNGNRAQNDENKYVHAQTAQRHKEASTHVVPANKSHPKSHKSSHGDLKVISGQGRSLLSMPTPGGSTRIKARR